MIRSGQAYESWKAWCALMSRKRNVKPRFYLILMTVLLAVFLGVYFSQNGFMNQRVAQIEQLESQRKLAEQQNAELERKISFAKTDEYVKRVAREELGLLQPGEIRYVSGTEVGTAEQQYASPQETIAPDGNAAENGQ